MEKNKFNPINYLYNKNNKNYEELLKEIKPRMEFTILNCGYNCKYTLDKLPLKRNKDILENSEFIKIMKKYNVKKCLYGHLHGESKLEAVEGKILGIELKLVSADYLDFKLYKVLWRRYKSIKGKIIKTISNIYIIKAENNVEYEAIARGKFKIIDIKPVCGDNIAVLWGLSGKGMRARDFHWAGALPYSDG